MLISLLIGGGIVLLIILFLATYKVVPPNEAHIIVFMGKGRKLYSPVTEEGQKKKTAYFYIPFLMQKDILPLTNVKMDIPNIHLNDIAVAPFVCDVITWIHIDDPIKAVERLNVDHRDGVFGSLREDLINIVQAIARAVSMKSEILEIMKDRKKFATDVSTEVDGVLKSWGVELVNLEVNSIDDDDEKKSTVITDYESIRKVEINTKARKEIAQKDREAVEVEQENRQKAEVAKAVSEEVFTKRQIEKDKTVGIANQNKQQEIARAQELANEQEVSALRRLQVGTASVEKEANIERAIGLGEAIRIQGEKEANVVQLKGEAEGKAIVAKGLADATAKDKMAEAMQKFNDAATNIEKIRAWIEVQKAQWEAYGKVAENAKIDIVQSGKGGNILGFPVNAESGFDLQQFLKGVDLSKITNAIKSVVSKKKDSQDTKES